MIKKIDNININYEDYGEGENTIVLLHGWGQNIGMMKPIGDRLKKDNRIVIIDLPGFGATEEPDDVWSIYDYADNVNKLLNSIKVKNPIMIGHSFGGKISLAYASKYCVQKLVLFGSPFRKGLKKASFKVKVYKTLKKIPLLNKLEGFAKKHIGSTDYKQASEKMRNILVKHVNLDISEDIRKIKCPTLIIWGTNDQAVPLSEAYVLEKLIKDAAVIEYEGCTHYAYLERLNQTINILKNFIGG